MTKNSLGGDSPVGAQKDRDAHCDPGRWKIKGLRFSVEERWAASVVLTAVEVDAEKGRHEGSD
jgi:hypothetical protein